MQLTIDDFGASRWMAPGSTLCGRKPFEAVSIPNGLNRRKQRALVLQACSRPRRNRKEARTLGVSRDQLALRLKKYGRQSRCTQLETRDATTGCSG